VSNGSTLLLGLEGIVVDTVHRNDDGGRVVTVRTAPEYVGRCTKCRTRSRRSRGWVTTRPRDIKVGPDRPRIVWQKRKWLCTNRSCYAFELMSQIRLKIPSHSWACRARSEAGYEVEFGGEFNSQEQAACAGAESDPDFSA